MSTSLCRQLMEAIHEKTDVFVMYGQTEATARLTWLPPTSLDSKAGSVGIPNLEGSGDLSPGGVGFTLTTNALLPFTAGVTWVSLTEGAVPFKGGTIYSFPILLEFNVAANLFGIVILPGAIDNSIAPGTEFVLQQAFADPGAVKGVSLTNGLKLTIGS